MENQLIGKHFAELSGALLSVDRTELERAIHILKAARREKKSVWIVGNGGSAATASHFANDLSKMCSIKAFSIPDMTPTISAYGNDEGWVHMFEHALDVYLESGDVLVAISCGGRSPNVLNAVTGLDKVIVMTGNDLNSPLAGKRAQALLLAPSDDITIQEDVHLAMCHVIAKALRQ